MKVLPFGRLSDQLSFNWNLTKNLHTNLDPNPIKHVSSLLSYGITFSLQFFLCCPYRRRKAAMASERAATALLKLSSSLLSPSEIASTALLKELVWLKNVSASILQKEQ